MKNVILLTIDALRKDMLGFYGCKENLTPFIDSLSDKVLVFTDAYAVAPYTQASFPGILTSSYYFDSNDAKHLSGKRRIVSETLKKDGMYTAAFHSNPYLSSYFGWDRGWDRFYDSMDEDVEPENPYIKGNVLNRKMDSWLSSYKKGESYQPFFLWIHYMDLHEPYVPDSRYLELVEGPPTLSKEQMLRLFKEVIIPRDVSDPETVELLKKLYKAHIREIDDHTRMLFDILLRNDISENTVLILTSDHGEEFAEHGSLSHNGKMYGELIDIPLIIWNLDEHEGKQTNKLVSGLDLAPTILHLFDLDPEESFQGQSLLPLSDYPDQGCFGEAIGKLAHRIKKTDRPSFYYLEKGVKIIYRQEENEWVMYDLKTDPGETKNIVDSDARAARMKKKLEPRISKIRQTFQEGAYASD